MAKKARNYSFILLVLAVVAGLAAAGLSVKVIHAATNSKPVVVAAEKIHPYTEIRADQLKIEQLPRSAVKNGMYPKKEPVVGQVARSVIPEGWPVSKQLLAIEGEGGLLATRVTELNDPQVRAFSLKVDQVEGLGGNLVPGDRVDVIGAMKLPINGVTQPVSKVIAKNVEVLDIIRDKEKIQGIIVALTPQEAQDAQFALLSGTVSLDLNPYDADVAAADTTPTTAESFIAKYIDAEAGEEELTLP